MEAPLRIAVVPAVYRSLPARLIAHPLQAILLTLFLSGAMVSAATYQWLANPGSGDWNTPTNWTGSTVPNSPTDSAEFATSSVTSVSLSAPVTVNGATFDAGASAYTIDTGANKLSFTGAGVTNSSGTTQNFTTNGGGIEFSNSASAGSMTVYTNNGAGSYVRFKNTSDGANAAFVNNNATASIDISGATTGTTLGSVAGNGALFLGSKTLTVGSLNSSTAFSGVVQDGGNSGGSGGSLTKVGTGTLTLSAANTYTGVTTVNAGTLNVTGSIAGSADIVVDGGTLMISSGGSVTGDDTTLNNAGTISVVGTGSKLINGFPDFINDGTLNVSAGATVTSVSATIGQMGTANVSIDGVGSKWTSSGALVSVGSGSGGTGTISVTNGGALDTQNVNIGDSGTGAVTVTGPGSNWTNNGGTTEIGNGGGATGTLTISGGATVSNGNADIGNGDSTATGSVTVDGTGSTWTNSGDLIVANGGTGSLTISNNGAVSAATTTIGNNGTVTDDATLTSPGGVAVNSGGLLKGVGVVSGDTVNDGTVAPGSANLGTLHITGTYQQNSGGTLDITIGSLAFYDSLAITGSASLSGTLDVMLAGYTGNAGDVFTIVTSSSLSGNFSTIILPSLSGGLFFTESTDANNVYLTVNGPEAVPEMSTWAAGLLAAGSVSVSLFRRISARRSDS